MALKERNRKLTLKIMFLLSVVGFIIASYQTYEHYFLTASVCDFTAEFSCSVVTESRYGEFPLGSGIAVAAYGAFWWFVLIGLLYKSIRKSVQEFYIFLWILIGVPFVVYLVVVELYILPMEIGQIVICPFCTVQHIFIAILLALSFALLKKPVKEYFVDLFYIKQTKKLNPKPFFVAGVTALIAIGGYFILGLGETAAEINYYGFAQCLAEKNATMYGFKACPNCNKQEHIIGVDAFRIFIEETGRYVKCRPESEALQPIGARLHNISVLPQYRNKITESTTQGELCTLMVGLGTPTWIINGKQTSGWKTIPELAELSGCPVPANFKGAVVGTGKRVTPVGD
jgi:uncharacterized membrane protein